MDLQEETLFLKGWSLVYDKVLANISYQEHHRPMQNWPEPVGILGDLGGILHLLDLDQPEWLLPSAEYQGAAGRRSLAVATCASLSKAILGGTGGTGGGQTVGRCVGLLSTTGISAVPGCLGSFIFSSWTTILSTDSIRSLFHPYHKTLAGELLWEPSVSTCARWI